MNTTITSGNVCNLLIFVFSSFSCWSYIIVPLSQFCWTNFLIHKHVFSVCCLSSFRLTGVSSIPFEEQLLVLCNFCVLWLLDISCKTINVPPPNDYIFGLWGYKIIWIRECFSFFYKNVYLTWIHSICKMTFTLLITC